MLPPPLENADLASLSDFETIMETAITSMRPGLVADLYIDDIRALSLLQLVSSGSRERTPPPELIRLALLLIGTSL